MHLHLLLAASRHSGFRQARPTVTDKGTEREEEERGEREGKGERWSVTFSQGLVL